MLRVHVIFVAACLSLALQISAAADDSAPILAPATISGTVYHVGQPVAGAYVGIVPFENGQPVDAKVAVVQSGADGTFNLETTATDFGVFAIMSHYGVLIRSADLVDAHQVRLELTDLTARVSLATAGCRGSCMHIIGNLYWKCCVCPPWWSHCGISWGCNPSQCP